MSTEQARQRSNRGFSLPGPLLYRTAIDALKRCVKESAECQIPLRSNDPYVAIVFAAASFEAFLNDIIKLAHHTFEGCSPDDPQYSAPVEFAMKGMEFLKSRRATTEDKIKLVYDFFFGAEYPKTEYPFNDWNVLREVRNMLMHLKSDSYVEYEVQGEQGEQKVVYPPIVENELRPRNILIDPNIRYSSWEPLIQTTGAARWACDVAYAMIIKISDIFSEGIRPKNDGPENIGYNFYSHIDLCYKEPGFYLT